jgi:hypothetical protein
MIAVPAREKSSGFPAARLATKNCQENQGCGTPGSREQNHTPVSSPPSYFVLKI